MLRLFFLCGLIFIAAITEAAPSLQLREQLRSATAGDFIVTSQNKAYTLLHVFSIQQNRLVIEEITVPEYQRDVRNQSWREWIGKGAPKHTAWVMYEINLQEGEIQEYFNFTKNGWMDVSGDQSFLSQLLNLELERVPDAERRRQGAPQMGQKQEIRRLWQPRLVLNGQRVKGVTFAAWRAEWPKDGSDLSGKRILLYLPETEGNYPSFFPYWLEVESTVVRAHLQLVDSGQELTSPQHPLPRRPLEVLSAAEQTSSGLQFRVKSRPYYQEFMIEAWNESDFGSEPIKLAVQSVNSGPDNVVTLEVPNHALRGKLVSGQSYLFTIVPVEYESAFTRTREPFRWQAGR